MTPGSVCVQEGGSSSVKALDSYFKKGLNDPVTNRISVGDWELGKCISIHRNSHSISRTRSLAHIHLHVCQDRWKKMLGILLLVIAEDLKPVAIRRTLVKNTGQAFKSNRTEVEKSSKEIVLTWKIFVLSY